jgi:hypothetical protein
MTQGKQDRMTREEACAALDIAPVTFARLEAAGILAPDPDGLYHPLAVAAPILRFGLGRAEAAERKVAAVGAALGEVRPALERLAALADRASLSGETHGRVTAEVAAFFTAFAAVMNRATAALAGEEGAGEEGQGAG